MIIHTAHLTCKPDVVDIFRDRLLHHSRTTRELEPGCRQFLVHQSASKPELFFLHEIYEDDAALRLHQDSDYFHSFRDDTYGWVTERRWWFWTLVQ